ncbi:hypothetical protein LOK49_LG06G02885 [Camellia lanceoleosa]|uniref:Uncharacterized protein n=1 Tax=Camellia lanceoleosa TaxID=1840588 RepID=A0ACC0HH97_9ERIC|nr:hypothetical protein LOK49_LG06G02885 [Camellia lanceoleosa]
MESTTSTIWVEIARIANKYAYIDRTPFYTSALTGWENAKAECLYDDGENQVKQEQSIADSFIFRSFVDLQIQQNTVSKLEDFLGGEAVEQIQA